MPILSEVNNQIRESQFVGSSSVNLQKSALVPAISTNNIESLQDIDGLNLSNNAIEELSHPPQVLQNMDLRSLVERENAKRNNKSKTQRTKIINDNDTIGAKNASMYKTLAQEPLKWGMKGSKVSSFQKALNCFVPCKSTGTYDWQTVQSVKKFQRNSGIKQDGIVGNMTYGHLWNRSFWEKGIVPDLNSDSFYKNFPKNLRLSVNLNEQKVYIVDKDQDRVVRSYPVSTGTSAHPTPMGSNKITQIKEKPCWYPPSSSWAQNASVTKPGPNNPLGPVKMRLGGSSILFHGTTASNFWKIGKYPSSHGCMRMFPQDAWEMHKLIKSGTPVVVTKW